MATGHRALLARPAHPPTMPQPEQRTERLFDGAVVLARATRFWDGMRAELLTMQREGVAENDLLIDRHALFIGVGGKSHAATLEVEGAPSWQGPKGYGTSGFFPAGRRLRSWHSQGVNKTLMLFFDDGYVEGLVDREIPLIWQSRPSADDAFIAAAGLEIASAFEDEADDLATLRAETIAASLNLYAARRFSNLALSRQTGGDRIGRAIDMIHGALPKAVSLADLVAVSGLPRAQLLAEFRTRTGVSPHQYIIRERLGRAKFLLSTTSRSLAEIAREVGCANPEHLGQMFRQRLQMSPRAWRRMNDRR